MIKENVMKKFGVAMMVAAFVLSAGAVFAAKCTVDSVDGNKMTVTCDKVDVKAGDTVTVKAKKSLEGC
jgi:plastocyanin